MSIPAMVAALAALAFLLMIGGAMLAESTTKADDLIGALA